MYSNFLKNRVCKGSNGFQCTLCNVEIINLEHVNIHIANNEKHLQLMKNISSLKNFMIDEEKCIELINNGIVPVSNKEYKCLCCSCSIPKFHHISEHISGKKHIIKRRKVLPDFITSNFINLINSEDQVINKEESDSNSLNNTKNKSKDICPTKTCTRNSSIYCNNCQGNLESDSALLYHKMFHLSQRSCSVYDIISFSIKKNIKSIYCLICNHTMSNEIDLEKHLEEVIHLKRLVIICCPSNNTIINMMYLNSILYQSIAFPTNANNIYSTLNAEFNRQSYYLGYNIYCNTFQTTVQNNHINNKINKYEIMNKNTSLVQNQYNIQDTNILPIFFCFICDIKFIDENLLFLHYNYDYIHKYRMEAINLVLKDKNIKFVTFSNNEILKCLKCQIELTELNGAITHIFETRHIIENSSENETIVSNNKVSVYNNCLSRNMYICPICKINVTYDYMMVQHLESDYHVTRVREYYTNVNCGSFEKIIFFCPLCKINFFNDRTILEHFYNTHEIGFKNIQKNNLMVTNSTNMNLTNISFMKNSAKDQIQLYYDSKYRNINSVRTNEKQCTFTLNKDNQNSSSIATIRTKCLINFSPRYVKMCIESGEENIFKINTEIIRKLKLSIHLTFPYESNRGCIPCCCEISNDPQLLYEHFRTEKHEKNLQEMEENHEFFKNFPDQFSDLDLAESYMYEESLEWIKCLTCDIKIENCDKNIHSHIKSQSHIDHYEFWRNSADEIFTIFKNIFENLWYYIEKFFCYICSAQFEFEVDYARHLESTMHFKEVEKRILRKQSLQFDCCILCSSYWYAKCNQHTIHCNKNSHKYILKSRDFTVPKMTELSIKLLNSVEQIFDKCVADSDKVLFSKQFVEKKILSSVEMTVKSKYPEAKAYLFGSRISYLSFEDSDLNIYIDCNNKNEKLQSIDQQLLVAQDCFHKHQDIWIFDDIIMQSKVPIIKIRHRSTNLNCDVSFNNRLCMKKSEILGYFVNAYLPCRKLILYLKNWCNYCQIAGKNGLTSFAISWLVIFYLQIEGIFPCVQYLIKIENNSNITDGWETGISKIIPVKEVNLSTKNLLLGFFLFYSEFDYISDIACPFLGKIMKKSKFSDIDNLPEELNIYKTQIKNDKVEFFRLDSPMCIQDPIDLSQNLTKAVTKLHLRMFKQYCAESAASLQN